jgi:ribosome biogenesis ATPase
MNPCMVRQNLTNSPLCPQSGSKPTLCADVSLAALGECPQTDGYTGADLAALVREAAMQALREHLAAGAGDKAGPLAVADKHFAAALSKIRPSVSAKVGLVRVA